MDGFDVPDWSVILGWEEETKECDFSNFLRQQHSSRDPSSALAVQLSPWCYLYCQVLEFTKKSGKFINTLCDGWGLKNNQMSGNFYLPA